ncbi:MAG TPA: S16 family serine protease, partial [Thermoanaerobaculia bacterium]|nr:S16 family serine protease [Thermoanaerobaculia bacterium]
MRLNSMMQLAQESERGPGQFLVLGPFQLWRKPAAHLELEEVFRLFLARRPDEARERCEQFARKYRGKDADLYKLAVLGEAWIAELTGDLDQSRSILENLGNEKGFETDGDRVLALARIYERVGDHELLEKAVHIYKHLERSFERVSVLGHLTSLYGRLGNREEAARYEERFVKLFRLRMHRPSFADAARVAARRYVPLAKLARIPFAGTDGLAESAPRERAIGLYLSGDVAGCRRLLEGRSEVLDLKYRADLAVLAGSLEEGVDLYLQSLEADPGDVRVLEWLLNDYESSRSARIEEYFKRPGISERALERLDASLRASPRRPSLWRQVASLHQILGHGEEAGRSAQRAESLEEAADRRQSTVGRVLADSVYHFVGRAKGLIHEVWVARRPAAVGRGGFLEEILGNLTPEFSQAVRNTFLSVREYARAKWPQQTRDILDYTYTYKVTKEDEASGGLSAGLPTALAFLSVFLNRPVPQDIASTGILIADSHDVQVLRAVGEPEYKVRGAYNRNLQKVILPEANRRDLEGNACVPRVICEEIVRYASNLDEAVVLTFGSDV